MKRSSWDTLTILGALLALAFVLAAIYDLTRVISRPDCRDILREAAAMNYALLNSIDERERKILEAKIAKHLAQQCAFE